MRTSVEMVTLLLPLLQLLFIHNPALGLQTRAESVPLMNDTDFIGIGEDEGSGEVEPDIYNVTEPEKPDSLPHLVVTDAAGQPCLLATLNATMQVSYQVPEGIVHETYIAVADIQLPEDVHAQGQCGENTSLLLLDWGNNTFHVNITFTRKKAASAEANATWSLTALSIAYDLSNFDVFPASSERGIVTLERQNLALFTTPVGVTHVCNNDVKVLVGSNERGVMVNFHNVRLAAFGVQSSEFPSTIVECAEEETSESHEEILVPLIVACCLSAIVIIVVVAYVISRKVQAARDQSEYRPMP